MKSEHFSKLQHSKEIALALAATTTPFALLATIGILEPMQAICLCSTSALSFAAGWAFKTRSSPVGHLDFDANHGEIFDKQIRYLLIRPDSIMGMFSILDVATAEKALLALQESVYVASSKSFREYIRRSPSGEAELESLVFRTAGILGWGSWEVASRSTSKVEVLVTNSPFVIERPKSEVLHTWQYAPIAGILRALYTISASADAQSGVKKQAVVEVLRMEGTSCTFHVTLAT
jgi:hypothetical protein